MRLCSPQRPNPAVERTCAKSRAGRSLLRWASHGMGGRALTAMECAMTKLADAAFGIFSIIFIPLGAAITFVGLPLLYVSLIVLPVLGLTTVLSVTWWLAFLIWWCQLVLLIAANVGGGAIFMALLLIALSGNAWLYYKGAQFAARLAQSCIAA